MSGPYRIVLAEREHWRRIVSSPHFGDLRVPLGAPQEAIEVGAL